MHYGLNAPDNTGTVMFDTNIVSMERAERKSAVIVSLDRKLQRFGVVCGSTDSMD
jgi:hypothetical protein